MKSVSRFLSLWFSGILLVLLFQNCDKINSVESVQNAESSLEGTEPPQTVLNGNGHGYDGKVYAHIDPSITCDDGSNVINQILVDFTQAAFLIKKDCHVIDPFEIPANEIQITEETVYYSGLEFSSDECVSKATPHVGIRCAGGAIYAGRFDYLGEVGIKKIMVTPGNCENSTNPVCDNQMDQLQLEWGNSGTRTNLTGTYDGEYNTNQLVEVFGPSPAAQYCYDLNFGGYSDWFLPSTNELVMILQLGRDGIIEGIQPSPTLYWSSTGQSEYRAQARAWNIKPEVNKTEQHYIRCIRSFE